MPLIFCTVIAYCAYMTMDFLDQRYNIGVKGHGQIYLNPTYGW